MVKKYSNGEKMKIEEIKALNEEEIKERIVKLKGEIAKERALIASGSRAEKPAKIRNLRKDIARMLTILNQRKKVKKTQ